MSPSITLGKVFLYSGRILIEPYKNEPEKIVNGLQTPLIDIETYERVQNILKDRRRYSHKPNKQNNHLPLRGFLSCKTCGSNLTGSASVSQTGDKHYYYHGSHKKGCKTRYRADIAHQSFESLLNSYKPNDSIIAVFESILLEKHNDSERSVLSQEKKISNKILEQNQTKKILLKKLVKGVIDDETYKSEVVDINQNIQELEKEKTQLKRYEKDSLEFVRFGVYLLRNLGFLFKKASINTNQKIISSIFKEKLVFDGERYRTPILNKGVELITRSINALDAAKTKNERQSLDYLPLCTPNATYLELLL